MNRDDTPLDPLKGDVRSSSHAPVARILWSNPGNPPGSVARALGMEPRRFSRPFHKIKAASDLSGPPP
jgi:hypothetical protein